MNDENFFQHCNSVDNEYIDINDIINNCEEEESFIEEDFEKEYFFQLTGLKNNKAVFNLVDCYEISEKPFQENQKELFVKEDNTNKLNEEINKHEIKKEIEQIKYLNDINLHLYVYSYTLESILNNKFFRLTTMEFEKNGIIYGQISFIFTPSIKLSIDNAYLEIDGSFSTYLETPLKKITLLNYDDYPSHNNLFPLLFNFLTHPEIIDLFL